MSQSADVIICGAGIAGIAAAYSIKQAQPYADVLLVDKLPPMSLTSIKSGELYRNWWLDETMAHWIQKSIEMMEAHARKSHNRFHMNRRGYAFVYTSKNGVKAARQSVEQFGNFGIGPVRVHDSAKSVLYQPVSPHGFDDQPDGVDFLLDQELIRRHFPYITEDARAVIHARRCGWFSAQQFGLYLLELAKALGLKELRGEIIDIEQDGHGIKAVEVQHKDGTTRVETRTVINAAGPFFAHLAFLVGLELPVYSVLHQLVVMPDPLRVIPREAPFTILADSQTLDWTQAEQTQWRSDSDTHWLLEPFPGALHVRPEGVLEGNWIRLGWPYTDTPGEPDWEPDFPAEFPEVVLRGATRFVPGLQQYVRKLPGKMGQDGGFYTKTKENLPLIGPSDIDGFYLLGALSGYGLMAACTAGELITQWITGGQLPKYARYFSLARYSDPAVTDALKSKAASGEL
jgi:glycine/D-amino acid oxidase-like deaminating enzyme